MSELKLRPPVGLYEMPCRLSSQARLILPHLRAFVSRCIGKPRFAAGGRSKDRPLHEAEVIGSRQGERDGGGRSRGRGGERGGGIRLRREEEYFCCDPVGQEEETGRGERSDCRSQQGWRMGWEKARRCSGLIRRGRARIRLRLGYSWLGWMELRRRESRRYFPRIPQRE